LSECESDGRVATATVQNGLIYIVPPSLRSSIGVIKGITNIPVKHPVAVLVVKQAPSTPLKPSTPPTSPMPQTKSTPGAPRTPRKVTDKSNKKKKKKKKKKRASVGNDSTFK